MLETEMLEKHAKNDKQRFDKVVGVKQQKFTKPELASAETKSKRCEKPQGGNKEITKDVQSKQHSYQSRSTQY